MLGVLSSMACADEQSSFFILGNAKVDAPQCIASAEGSATLIISGVMDVALSPDYEATLLVGSQLAPRGDKANLRTETMITTVSGAEVHLHNDTGALEVEAFTVPATGVIRPEAGDDPGFGVVVATLVPAGTLVAAAPSVSSSEDPDVIPFGNVRTLVAEVTVFGKTIGGLDVESAPFSYVIRACNGCLIDFPAEAIVDPMVGCFASAEDTALVPPCRVGQDEAVDCRICSGSNNPYCIFPGGVAPTP